ncbi:hemerythrin domain-containing protein [Nocardioides gilvus]|uniref:hemerythrin domain-containing protein n=1 Tax=Nocardioides gilvus TaxID=1735589 RepID=UPI000D7496B9|nr:hemerythrin domain-containing protein [Nocardioides gilvus]
MRSLADQVETQLGSDWSLLVRQKRDHQLLVVLLERLSRDPGPDQDEVLREVCRVVFPHAFADESVLWPAVRKHLPYGETLVQQMDEERREVNELAGRLQDEDLEPTERSRLVERLHGLLLDAVRHEEEVLLPLLQSRVEEGRLRQLGFAWDVVRRAAPTRPHPVLVRHRVSNCLVLLPLTILDRSRDRRESSSRVVPDEARTALRIAS